MTFKDALGRLLETKPRIPSSNSPKCERNAERNEDDTWR